MTDVTAIQRPKSMTVELDEFADRRRMSVDKCSGTQWGY